MMNKKEFDATPNFVVGDREGFRMVIVQEERERVEEGERPNTMAQVCIFLFGFPVVFIS
jgi:hypothetical protein